MGMLFFVSVMAAAVLLLVLFSICFKAHAVRADLKVLTAKEETLAVKEGGIEDKERLVSEQLKAREQTVVEGEESLKKRITDCEQKERNAESRLIQAVVIETEARTKRDVFHETSRRLERALDRISCKS